MAIDPSISLAVRPPVIPPLQIQSPLERYAKMLSLRNLMTENQSGQLGLQAQQMKMQEAQRGLQDEEKLRANPTMSDAELIGAFGSRAMPLIKARGEQTQQFYKTEGERYGLLGQLAGSATDKDSATRAVGLAIRSRAFDPDPAKNAEIGQQMMDHLNTNGFNPEEFKQYQFMAMKGKESHDAMVADAEAKLKEPGVKADAAKKEAEAEITRRQMEASALAPALQRGAVAYQQALANLKPERRALYLDFQTPRDLLMFANTPHEQIMAQQAADAADLNKYGKTIPYPQQVQAQKVEEAGALAGARTNVMQTPQKIAQDIQIAAETAKAVAAAKPPEKATPAERKSLSFWERGKFAADSIEPLEEGIAKKNYGQQAWLEFMPNASQSEKDQKYRQAQRQFTESHLRPESGAAISATEYANDARTYFAVPGDTPGTLAQKRAARAVILEGLKTEAGAAYEQKHGKQPPTHEKGSDPGGIR